MTEPRSSLPNSSLPPLGPLPAEVSRALASLPPPPPPPPVESVFAGIDAGRRALRAKAFSLAAVVLLLLGAAIASGPRTPDAPPRLRIDHLRTKDGESLTDARVADSRVGMFLGVSESSRYRIEGRVELEGLPTRSAEVRIEAADRFALESGAATFHVDHRAGAPVRVRARAVEIVDVGTTFTVDLGDADAATLVTVAEGAVEANGVRVPAGFGLGFLGRAPGGAPWRLDAKPTVSLEAGDAPARAGGPVELRLVLSNPTDRRMSLPAPDPLGAPLFVDVTAPSGAATPIRVTPSMWVDFDRLKAGIPPRGRTAVGVRFDTTFASPGTYRLRAVVQPAGTTDQPRSDELTLTVR